jgi:hypothetical protein
MESESLPLDLRPIIEGSVVDVMYHVVCAGKSRHGVAAL